jgi:hypothetical protein
VDGITEWIRVPFNVESLKVEGSGAGGALKVEGSKVEGSNVQPSNVQLSTVWLGIRADEPLEAARYWRGVEFRSHPVEMGGAVWRVPVARLMGGGSGLPSVRGFGAGGVPAWKPRAEYRELAAYAETVFDCLVSGEKFTDADGDLAVSRALGVGYRLGLEELLALEVLGPETVAAVVKALVDYPEVERALQAQKKTSDMGGISCGGPA